MRRNPRFFRLTATVALTALLCDMMLPLAAVAQPAPPPIPEPGQGRPDLTQGDPPARVGRIADLTGVVSFHDEGDTSWSAASLNYPVSSGNAFWTEPSANARLEISDSRIVMNSGTEFDVTTLDASGLQGVLPQGETYIHLRDLAPNEVWSIQTPRGLVRLSGQGRYGIVVGTTDQPTMVTVIDGTAQIDGPGVRVQVASGQTATIIGIDAFQGSIGPAIRDPFLTASLDAERPTPAPTVPVPAQVALMAGGSDLVGIGSWANAPEYGQVWYPPVSTGWVPYREGHWAYVAPWGWTWIDNASWGFAPFHYGRWVQIGGRWAWTPGIVTAAGRPVYAPALVTFIGIGAGIALGAAITPGTIGWVPLGPREPFHPWYHASPNYLREVNATHVTNATNTNITIDNYVNRSAATSIPAAAMTGSRPIQGIARPVTDQEFTTARPIVGQQPVRPTATTAGVTSGVARRLDLAPTGTMHPAPGPVVRPVAAGTTGFARPAQAPVGSRRAVVEPGHPSPIAPGAYPAVPAITAPGRPTVPPETEARPNERPGTQVHPEVRPLTPVQPETRQEPPARLEGRPTLPAQSIGRPETPARPEVRPATPTQPAARPPAPARPEMPARPEVRPTGPANPAFPVRPEIRPTAPARPENRPAPPARPQPPEHKKQPGER